MSAAAGAGSTLRSALSTGAMRRALFGYLAFATTEWAAWVAILLFAYQRGGTAAVGLIAVVQLVPAIAVAPLGGTLAERLDRRTALLVAYTALGATCGLMWLALTTEAPTWLFYLLAVASNCAVTLCRPAHFAALPRLAADPKELVAANSASTTLENLGVFLGPALIAVLIPLWGVQSVFLALFLLEASSVLLVLTMRLPLLDGAPDRATASDEDSPSGFVSDAVGGFREVRATPGAGVLLALVGVQFVIVGMLDVLGVVFPQDVLGTGESGASVIIAASGVGGLVGAAATVMLVGRRRMSPSFVAGFVGAGFFLALVSMSSALWGAAVLVGASGFARAFIDVSGRTLLQRTVKEDALARVFGLQESVLMLGLTVGSVVAPLAVAATGARGAFVVAGAGPALLALLAWPALRRLDREAVLPGPEFELLQAIPMFAPLPLARLEMLSHRAVAREVPEGTAVIRQGQVGDRFYVVVDGLVSVDIDGREVNQLGSGNYFGEVALLRDAPRNATVTTMAPTQLLVINRDDFLSAVTGHAPSRDAAERVVKEREVPPPGIA